MPSPEPLTDQTHLKQQTGTALGQALQSAADHLHPVGARLRRVDEQDRGVFAEQLLKRQVRELEADRSIG